MYPAPIGIDVMRAKIRGTADDPTRMMLGQIRQVFDPDWIQSFHDGKNVLIKFHDGTDAVEELEQFAEMYGYTLEEEPPIQWERFRLKSE